MKVAVFVLVFVLLLQTHFGVGVKFPLKRDTSCSSQIFCTRVTFKECCNSHPVMLSFLQKYCGKACGYCEDNTSFLPLNCPLDSKYCVFFDCAPP